MVRNERSITNLQYANERDLVSAVYIEPDLKLLTNAVPHKKIHHAGFIWMIAPLPAGDFAFHRQHLRDQNGYGGSVIDFLMEDGEIESLRGPYHVHELSEFGTHLEAEKITGILGVLAQATKITVGKNVGYFGTDPQIVYRETEWKLGNWKTRVKAEWKGLEFRIECRGMVVYPSKSDIADMFRTKPYKSKIAVER